MKRAWVTSGAFSIASLAIIILIALSYSFSNNISSAGTISSGVYFFCIIIGGVISLGMGLGLSQFIWFFTIIFLSVGDFMLLNHLGIRSPHELIEWLLYGGSAYMLYLPETIYALYIFSSLGDTKYDDNEESYHTYSNPYTTVTPMQASTSRKKKSIAALTSVVGVIVSLLGNIATGVFLLALSGLY